MRWASVVWVCVACAPPPAVELGDGDGEPSVAILYPPSGATDIGLDLDGVLRFTVVVDINGLTFVPAHEKDEIVAGEGHWHLDVNNDYIGPATELFWEYESTPGQFTVGQAISVEVELVEHTHVALVPPVTAVVEFNVAEPL